MNRKRILLLGSTGSIGTSTCAVVDNLADELEIVALAAHKNWSQLLEQTRKYRPLSVALTDDEAAARFSTALATAGLEPAPKLYSGPNGLVELVRESTGDVVVGAISGAAGLPANLAALESGKDLALANKESLVMSGALLMERAKLHGRRVLPVDSEHSAIFQSLLSGRREEVARIILTASGGPFRASSLEEIRAATKAQALNHPTWDMGAKITIDSATLMNKALEVIEARWLFDAPAETIEVVVHPQSIIHSLVEFQDGSVICQLGPPDMRIPIQYALTYPNRRPLAVDRVSLAEIGSLSFFPPDEERFPALRLAYQVLRQGGTAPGVFNAANEVAVSAFLDETIPFPEIIGTVERTLAAHTVVSHPDLDQIFAADAWARDEARQQLRQIQLK